MARFHVNEALQNFEGRAEMIERLSISRGRGGIGSLSLSFSLYLFSNTEPAVSSFVSKSRHSFFMRLRDPRHRNGQRKTDRACSKRKRKRHCCSCQSIERLFPFFVLGRKFSSRGPREKQKTNYKDGHHVTHPTCLQGTGPTSQTRYKEIPTRTRILLSFSTVVSTHRSLKFVERSQGEKKEEFRFLQSVEILLVLLIENIYMQRIQV